MPPSTRTKSVENKSEVITRKKDGSKVIQLLLAANLGREIDKHIFSHESSPNPPSLSRKGQMFHGTKGDILPLLEAEEPPSPSTSHLADAPVLDGPAIVQLIKPGSSVTLGELYTFIYSSVPLFIGLAGKPSTTGHHMGCLQTRQFEAEGQVYADV